MLQVSGSLLLTYTYCARRLPQWLGWSYSTGLWLSDLPVCVGASLISFPCEQKAIETCTDPSGVIEKCGVFEFYDYDEHKDQAYCEMVR